MLCAGCWLMELAVHRFGMGSLENTGSAGTSGAAWSHDGSSRSWSRGLSRTELRNRSTIPSYPRKSRGRTNGPAPKQDEPRQRVSNPRSVFKDHSWRTEIWNFSSCTRTWKTFQTFLEKPIVKNTFYITTQKSPPMSLDVSHRILKFISRRDLGDQRGDLFFLKQQNSFFKPFEEPQNMS